MSNVKFQYGEYGRLFKEAQDTLTPEQFHRWLCYCYGYLTTLIRLGGKPHHETLRRAIYDYKALS